MNTNYLYPIDYQSSNQAFEVKISVFNELDQKINQFNAYTSNPYTTSLWGKITNFFHEIFGSKRVVMVNVKDHIEPLYIKTDELSKLLRMDAKFLENEDASKVTNFIKVAYLANKIDNYIELKNKAGFVKALNQSKVKLDNIALLFQKFEDKAVAEAVKNLVENKLGEDFTLIDKTGKKVKIDKTNFTEKEEIISPALVSAPSRKISSSPASPPPSPKSIKQAREIPTSRQEFSDVVRNLEINKADIPSVKILAKKLGYKNLLDLINQAPSNNKKKVLNAIIRISQHQDSDITLEQLQKVVEFERLIEEIAVLANKDLYLDEKSINQRFQIGKKLAQLPSEEKIIQRKELQQVLNQAYIKRELKNKAKIAARDNTEMGLLRSLGYDVGKKSIYQDKEMMYEAFKANLQKKLSQQKNPPTLANLKKIFDNCALEIRLKAAGLKEGEMEKFQASLEFAKAIKTELNEKCKNYPLQLPKNFPLSSNALAIKSMQKQYQAYQQTIVNKLIQAAFSLDKVQAGIKNDKVSIANFQKYLNKQFKEQIEFTFADAMEGQLEIGKTRLTDFAQEEVAFFAKWGSFLQKELVQGLDDSNEMLGEGICWGVTQRLRLNAQKNPDLTLEDFMQGMQIGAEDRYLQSLYIADLGFSQNEFPDILLKTHNYKQERQIFRIEGKEDEEVQNRQKIQKSLLREITSQAKSLKESNGWASFGLMMESSSHATLLRMNEGKPHQVWFFDPNVGLFSFEKGRSFQEARQLCCEFMNDLIKTFYSDIVAVSAEVLT